MTLSESSIINKHNGLRFSKRANRNILLLPKPAKHGHSEQNRRSNHFIHDESQQIMGQKIPNRGIFFIIQIIWDSLNPNFLKTFVIDYYFEK